MRYQVEDESLTSWCAGKERNHDVLVQRDFLK